MRRALLGVAVVTTLAAGVVAAVELRPSSGSRAAAAEPAVGTSTGPATSKVTKQDLVARQDLDGTLGYAGAATVVNARAGTLTAAPAAGATVDRGQALYWVDNRPVPLLFGDLPAWRRFAIGMSDGPDVRQLEANLAALGYDVTVDDTFNANTVAAIKKWQAALGFDQTGAVEPGDVVFLPGPVRIASVKEDRGAALRPGAPILDVTATTRVVRVDLDAAKQSQVKVGAKVDVRLPDGTTLAGTVTSVSSVARAGTGQGAKPTVPVEVTLDNPAAAGALDEAPVRVGIVAASRTGVLAVPVNALLALREGGYGVRVVDPTGVAAPRVVAVQTGLFAKGLVEVAGDLHEGDTVEVPAS